MPDQKRVDGSFSRIDDNKRLSQVKKTHLMVHNDLYSVYFQSSDLGWVGGDRVLAKTEDGGNTWKGLPFPGFSDGVISKIFFSSPKVGWILVQRTSATTLNSNDVGNSTILYRSVDSGVNWSRLLEWKDVILADARSDADGIWIVGTDSKTRSVLDDEPFAVRSTDEGRTWVSMVPSNLPQRPLGFRSLLMFENSVVGAVTTSRDVVAFDAGRGKAIADRSFRETAVGHRPAPIIFAGLLPSKSVWMVSSMDSSKEGMRSAIYVEGRDSVRRLSLNSSLVLNDGLVLSDGSVLLIGRGEAKNASYSVVLHSTDLTNWSKVVEDHDISSFFSAVEIKEHIWLVGSNSSITRLARGDWNSSTITQAPK